jgi:hypothetical protein
MYDMRTELPFQKAWPNMAMPSITGSEVGSFKFDDFEKNEASEENKGS